MLRKITKDIGRYSQGAVHDYPKGVWDKLAQDAGMKLEAFSEPIETYIAQTNMLKGRPRIRQRQGSAVH